MEQHCVDVVIEIGTKLSSVPGASGQDIATKFQSVLHRNPDFEVLKSMKRVLSSDATNEQLSATS